MLPAEHDDHRSINSKELHFLTPSNRSLTEEELRVVALKFEEELERYLDLNDEEDFGRNESGGGFPFPPTTVYNDNIAVVPRKKHDNPLHDLAGYNEYLSSKNCSDDTSEHLLRGIESFKENFMHGIDVSDNAKQRRHEKLVCQEGEKKDDGSNYMHIGKVESTSINQSQREYNDLMPTPLQTSQCAESSKPTKDILVEKSSCCIDQSERHRHRMFVPLQESSLSPKEESLGFREDTHRKNKKEDELDDELESQSSPGFHSAYKTTIMTGRSSRWRIRTVNFDMYDKEDTEVLVFLEHPILEEKRNNSKDDVLYENPILFYGSF
mmetsp:Transcript_30862/g.70598  ORF Transcript_30862/g.70598 Transcript_30862/m.70598 type:complete len:324 (-) Transcript_30862:138-1109(-)